MRIGRVVVAIALVVSACTGSHHAAGGRLTTTTASPRARTDCRDGGTSPTVRHLPSATGSVWVWIESAARPTARVDSLVKVVWRITGSGAPHAALSDPRGRASKLTFGPEAHRTSTFRHPGTEYGTGFTPTEPGCWRLTMRRGEVTASLSFAIEG